ncbi:hypothetical protein Gotri_026688, partial [Gossypium trilobum]|nr:hypothetical protein [Gossypium trilobum]
MIVLAQRLISRWRVNSGVSTVDRCNIQWRTWAARFIQAAWRRYSKRKIMEQRRKEEEEAEGSDGYLSNSGGGSYSLGASFLASKFAANALCGIHRNQNAKSAKELVKLQKPPESDFSAEDAGRSCGLVFLSSYQQLDVGPETNTNGTFREEASTRQKEPNALLKWKGSLDNQSQSSLSSWDGNGHCNWTGIICDKSRRVHQLNLSRFGLKGKLHGFSFSSFPKLNVIDLSSNYLRGTIPSGVGNLSRLTYLDLSSNNLSGYIPFEIGKLRSISELYLESNILTGSIPPSIGNLTDLSFLYLHKNKLSGSIPQQIGMLKSLYKLVLSDNNL